MSLIDRTDLPSARLNGAELGLGLGIGQRYTIVRVRSSTMLTVADHLRLLRAFERFRTRADGADHVHRVWCAFAKLPRLTYRRDPRQLSAWQILSWLTCADVFKRSGISPKI